MQHLSPDDLEKNPAVDMRLIEEAQRYRKELEDMGIHPQTQYRLRHPFNGSILRDNGQQGQGHSIQSQVNLFSH